MTSSTHPCLLSVVIPTYNRRELVLRAVRSVLDQDGGAHVQVVVVDDESSDGTNAALMDCYRAEPRVQLLTAPHRGASAARNLGFDAALGELVCFLDSDDFWLPGTLRIVRAVFAARPQLRWLAFEGCAELTSGQRVVERIVAGDSPGWSHAQFRRAQLESAMLELPGAAPARLLFGDYLPAIVHGDLFYLSGLVLRRESAVAAGRFNERFRYYNDWDYFARLCLASPGGYLDHDGFRRDTGRSDQISRNRPASAIARRQLFITHTLAADPRATRHAEVLRAALDDARYALGRALLESSTHRRWAARYLCSCLRHGYKPVRCLALLSAALLAAKQR